MSKTTASERVSDLEDKVLASREDLRAVRANLEIGGTSKYRLRISAAFRSLNEGHVALTAALQALKDAKSELYAVEDLLQSEAGWKDVADEFSQMGLSPEDAIKLAKTYRGIE